MPLTTNLLPLSRKARIAKPVRPWYNSLTLTLPCKEAGMPRERSNRMKILVFGSLNIGHTYIRCRIWCIHPFIEWCEEWADWQFATSLVVAPCDYSAIRFHLSLLPSLTFHELSQLLFL